MGKITPITGTGEFTPKNWIRLADVWAELTLIYMHGPSRPLFPSELEDVEAQEETMWRLLQAVEGIAVLGSNPDPIPIERNVIYERSSSISLQFGTIGSGPTGTVVLNKAQCVTALIDMGFSEEVVMEGFAGGSGKQEDNAPQKPPKRGRTRKVDAVASAYQQLFPNGHGGLHLIQVQGAIQEHISDTFVIRTLN